jgi:nucleoid-associated protein YgaU
MVMSESAQARSAVIAVAAIAGLLWAAPRPTQAVLTLRGAASAGDPAAPLVALVALLAMALLGWLLLVTLTVAATRVPGAIGGYAGTTAGRLAPAAVRRLVEITLGLTVATGVMATSPASASEPGPPPRPVAAAPALDWAHVQPEPAAAPRVAATPVVAPVVVRPGDSLWTIAAARLPDDATDTQIARAWPAWWSANREAIGTDPGLILPGLSLTPPARSTPS